MSLTWWSRVGSRSLLMSQQLLSSNHNYNLSWTREDSARNWSTTVTRQACFTIAFPTIPWCYGLKKTEATATELWRFPSTYCWPATGKAPISWSPSSSGSSSHLDASTTSIGRPYLSCTTTLAGPGWLHQSSRRGFTVSSFQPFVDIWGSRALRRKLSSS